MSFLTVTLLRGISGNVFNVIIEDEDNEAWYGKPAGNSKSPSLTWGKHIYSKV